MRQLHVVALSEDGRFLLLAPAKEAGKDGGKGHPLPESDEARHHEIPEQIEREKGRGEEGRRVVQPNPEAVNPDGEP